MLTPLRPLLHSSSSGSNAFSSQCPAAVRSFAACSSSNLSSSIPRWVYTPGCDSNTRSSRTLASNSSTAAVDGNASTLPGTLVLAHAYDGTTTSSHVIDTPESLIPTGVQGRTSSWDESLQPSISLSLNPAPLHATGAESPATNTLSAQQLLPLSPPHNVHARSPPSDDTLSRVQELQQQHTVPSRPPARAIQPPIAAAPGLPSAPQPPGLEQPQLDNTSRVPASAEPSPQASTSAPSFELLHRRGPSAQHRRRSPANSASTSTQTASSRSPQTHPPPRPRPPRHSTWPPPQPPAAPRLAPPPPPQSWPDYPYTRHPTATACHPADTAGLKLEALFQCVLQYPRVPPKLLRFLNHVVPGGVATRLPAVTATVEHLSERLGRELAVYLVRRRPWVVLVPAEVLGSRMDAVRQLLDLQPSEVLDLLRKNPNLLRMEAATLQLRYGALSVSTEFRPEQVRALVIKYPLILNFQPESVQSAAVALRRLCSARPDWAALHTVLSPSQFAFYMRDRVQTLLRLEYLLLTGGGANMTLRDIMKTSNNVFKKKHGGFRTWMTDRLRRLRLRLARARAIAQAEHAAEAAQSQPLSREQAEAIRANVEADFNQDEQRRFMAAFAARRAAEVREGEHRAGQRQRALEVKRQQQLEMVASHRQRGMWAEEGGEEGEEEEEGYGRGEEEVWAQQQRRPSGDLTGSGGGRVGTAESAAAAAAAGASAAVSAATLGGPSAGRRRSVPMQVATTTTTTAVAASTAIFSSPTSIGFSSVRSPPSAGGVQLPYTQPPNTGEPHSPPDCDPRLGSPAAWSGHGSPQGGMAVSRGAGGGGGDVLESVSPGQAWRRPGSKISPPPPAALAMPPMARSYHQQQQQEQRRRQYQSQQQWHEPPAASAQGVVEYAERQPGHNQQGRQQLGMEYRETPSEDVEGEGEPGPR